MRHTAFLFLLLSFCSLALAEPLLIEKPGDYVISETEKIGIEVKDNTLTLLRLATKGGISVKVVPGWKMYSDTANVLWVFDGEAELIRMEFTSKGIAFQESSHSREIWTEAPKPFVALLPKTRLRPLPKGVLNPETQQPGSFRPVTK